MHANKSQHTGSIGLMAATLLFVLLLLPGCGKKAAATGSGDTFLYLGDYSYTAPMTAMVYEDMDGEGKGIQYREVTDYDKMIAYSPVPVCVYFYSSLLPDEGTTADVEQMAEDYHGKILFVSADVNQEETLAEHFEINAVPDFVILDNGSLKAHFSSADGQQWTSDDLRKWVLANAKIA